MSDQQIQVAMVVIIQRGLCMMPQKAFNSYQVAMIIELVFWVIQLAFDWGMGSFGYSTMVGEWHNLGFVGCRRAL